MADTKEEHMCGNCLKVFDDIAKIPEAKNIMQRCDPGGVFPSGECDNCGSLVYPVTVEPEICQHCGAIQSIPGQEIHTRDCQEA